MSRRFVLVPPSPDAQPLGIVSTLRTWASQLNAFVTVLGEQPQSATAGDTTPSISGGSFVEITNASATNVTDFDDGRTGQSITVKIDANTTLVHDETKLYLANEADVTGPAVVTFWLGSDGVWYEEGRPGITDRWLVASLIDSGSLLIHGAGTTTRTDSTNTTSILGGAVSVTFQDEWDADLECYLEAFRVQYTGAGGGQSAVRRSRQNVLPVDWRTVVDPSLATVTRKFRFGTDVYARSDGTGVGTYVIGFGFSTPTASGAIDYSGFCGFRVTVLADNSALVYAYCVKPDGTTVVKNASMGVTAVNAPFCEIVLNGYTNKIEWYAEGVKVQEATIASGDLAGATTNTQQHIFRAVQLTAGTIQTGTRASFQILSMEET